MKLTPDDVVEAISQLVKEGYVREYRIKDGQIFDLTLNSPLNINDIRVDTALRMESVTCSPEKSGI